MTNDDIQRHIEADIPSSKNAVGLFRMFNTYNTKAKSMTVICLWNGRFT